MNICKFIYLVTTLLFASLPIMIGIKSNLTGIGIVGATFIVALFISNFEYDEELKNNC